MKKLLALLLAGILVFTLTSCKDKEKENVPGEISAEVRATKTFPALNILAGDTYMWRMNMDEMELMTVYRRGNDINIIGAEIETQIIVGGNFYLYDAGAQIAWYRPATQADISDLLDSLDGFDEIVDLRGAEFVTSGRGAFMNHGEMYFEEFRLADGSVRRTFFNSSDELFGFQGGAHPNIIFHVSANLPANAFEIPAHFTPRPWSERP
jgi:hypothetical protein